MQEISCKLKELGHEVFLATSLQHLGDISCYSESELPKIYEINLPRGSNFAKHFSSAKVLRKIVDEIKPDIIHTHFSAAIYTVALAKQKDWPRTIATFHGLSFPILKGLKKLAVGSAEKWAALNMDEVFVLNESDRVAFEAATGSTKAKICTDFGLGCLLNQFDSSLYPESEKVKIRTEIGIDHRHFNFIFIGRQVNFKGFAKVVRAFMRIYLIKPQTRLILVGTKDKIHETGLTASEIKEMNECRGIIQLGWQSNVQDYLAVSHVNVFPSKKEGIPVNLMESLAMGVPVVTINSRGCNEVVSHMENGIVLENDSEEYIFQAMRHLSEDSDLVKELSENAILNRWKFDRKFFIESQLQSILKQDFEQTVDQEVAQRN